MESSRGENYATKRQNKHEMYKATASETQHTVLQQTFFYNQKKYTLK